MQDGEEAPGHGPEGDGVDTRNVDRNDTTSALPRRSERSSVRLLRGRFDPLMVNIWEMELGKSCRPGSLEDLVGMSIDPHVTPDPGNTAVGADQNGCPKNSLKDPAIHRFFAPGTVRLQDLVLFI